MSVSVSAPAARSPSQASVRGSAGSDPSSSTTKLNQVVQNLFAKAANIVIQSRVPLPPVYLRDSTTKKTNKWFNLELDGSDAFRDELRVWRSVDLLADNSYAAVPPLVIETVLDTKDLTPSQILVILDQEGKCWNVDSSCSSRSDVRRREIVLERWKIELDPRVVGSDDLPVIYKRAIVLFRSLYTYVRLLPAWRLRRKIGKSKLHPTALNLSCRVLNGAHPISSRGRTGLSVPLLPDQDEHLEQHVLHRLDTPVGAFSVNVSYRKNCDFRVDDSESILSSEFLSMDRHTRQHQQHQHHVSTSASSAVNARRYSRLSRSPPTNSLPARGGGSVNSVDSTLPYGSLGAHNANAQLSASPRATPIPGSSQFSALRRDRSMSNSSSSARSVGIAGSHSSVRSFDQQNRPSIQPFKSPSLSESPSSDPMGGARYTYHRVSSSSSLAGSARPAGSRGSFSSGSHVVAQLAISPGANRSSTSIAMGSSTSPGLRRYSSSFGSRNQQQQQLISGSASSSSSTVPSFLRRESVSSTHGPITPEEDSANINDFMQMLESQGPLKSFSVRRGSSSSYGSTGSGGSGGSSLPKTSLSRFQILKESHAVLSDSMSASLYQPSQTAASPQLSRGSPGAGSVAVGSYSSINSGGKGVSPSTPHTPAIPSRLSEGLTAERYHGPAVFEDDDDDDDDDDGDEDEDIDVDDRDDDDTRQYGASDEDDGKYTSSPHTGSFTSYSARRATAETRGGSKRGRGYSKYRLSTGSTAPADGGAPGSSGGSTNAVADDDELLFAMSDMNSGVASLNVYGDDAHSSNAEDRRQT
ncbi:autophagy-related protein 13-domain-containing protein [Myxozyma melibiosi]|uniref:Autophagy-related protein 13 n=1 Tax=Myxozyma melibiosi TaxID=54550 RepID=A0ABR1F474_9ASCO